ncbi:MAG: glycosyltransferase family 4 protein [Desulfobacterales bacterium]|nr:glycosyltransferase family 4 protein [Desulfobacterales bacterium]
MKIGFDISQTGNNKAGCGYFADSLIQALISHDRINKYILYPHFGTSFWDPKGESTTRRFDHPHVTRRTIGKDFGKSMSFWGNLPDDGEKDLGNPDIIHSNNYSCPSGLRQARLVYTLYDLSFLEYPDLTTEENRGKCFEGVFSASIYADFIVSISDYSRKKFQEIFPHYPRKRIGVVPLGSRSFPEQTAGTQIDDLKGLQAKEFWLVVGTLEPRKNLRRLLQAFSDYVRQTNDPYPLALAGGKGWLEEDLEEFIRGLGVSNHVHILGYVSDQELAWLYRNCLCFVYPSLYEGFGLPVLEAMGQGAAVITSNTTSLPEVAGDAAHYIDPLDVHDIAEAFLKLGSDGAYREALRKKAVMQAEKFSWEKSAKQVLDIYNQAMMLPKFGVCGKKRNKNNGYCA